MDLDKLIAYAIIMVALSVVMMVACIRTVERKHEGSMFLAEEWRGASVLNSAAVVVVITVTSAFVSGAMFVLLSRWPIDITVWGWLVAWAVCGLVFTSISLPTGKNWFVASHM